MLLMCYVHPTSSAAQWSVQRFSSEEEEKCHDRQQNCRLLYIPCGIDSRVTLNYISMLVAPMQANSTQYCSVEYARIPCGTSAMPALLMRMCRGRFLSLKAAINCCVDWKEDRSRGINSTVISSPGNSTPTSSLSRARACAYVNTHSI